MGAFLGLAIGGRSLALPVAAAVPFSFCTVPGRLPKNVVPLDYTIAITPDAVARTLRGTESVTLYFKEPPARSYSIH